MAEHEEQANAKLVTAHRTLEVGKAQVAKDATIETALGESEAIRIRGEKEAEIVRLDGSARADATAAVGKAEAEVIKEKGVSEAEAKNKMADAMAKYNDAATGIEKIRAAIEIEQAKYGAIGKIAENAEFKIVTSGEGGNLFGLPLNAETGANLGQMLEGLDLEKIASLLPAKVVAPKEDE